MDTLEVSIINGLGSKIAAWKDLIEQSLAESLPPAEKTHQAPIHEAIRYSTLCGGHRYRPILLLAVADVFGVSHSRAVPLACMVEMIHSSSMILDDLPSFDNADVRHGKAACHKQFGEYIAILASHRLLSLCLETYWNLREDIHVDIRRSLETEYTSLINNMIFGEAMDLNTRHRRIGASDLIDIYSRKSALLFSFAAVSGALLGCASTAEIEVLRQYGLNLGLAYQILDDIYDVQGGPGNVGKDAGMDEKNGKATTFPLLYGVEKSIGFMNEYKSQAQILIAKFGEKFGTLEYLADLIVPEV